METFGKHYSISDKMIEFSQTMRSLHVQRNHVNCKQSMHAEFSGYGEY